MSLPFWRVKSSHPFPKTCHSSLSQIKNFPPLLSRTGFMQLFIRSLALMISRHLFQLDNSKVSSFTSQVSRGALILPLSASTQRNHEKICWRFHHLFSLDHSRREKKTRKKLSSIWSLALRFRPSFLTRETSRSDWDGSDEIISYQPSRFFPRFASSRSNIRGLAGPRQFCALALLVLHLLL